MPYATTVNVRDRLAGFIVGLASVADRWEMHPSAEKDRFRQGLGRSTDPKVVALRQAVLDKCVAIKGPSPGQGVQLSVLLNVCRSHSHGTCFRWSYTTAKGLN